MTKSKNSYQSIEKLENRQLLAPVPSFEMMTAVNPALDGGMDMKEMAQTGGFLFFMCGIITIVNISIDFLKNSQLIEDALNKDEELLCKFPKRIKQPAIWV
jgi:hypothetical protein